MQKILAHLIALALAAATAASAMAAPARNAAPSSATLTIHSSSYGRVLFDSRGFVLYAFTRDPHRKSACSGACAAVWPPYLVKTRPSSGPGLAASLLGTTRRADGKLQVTYGGRPLYYYIGDRKPGQILCQNVREYGGLWLVVRPTSALVR